MPSPILIIIGPTASGKTAFTFSLQKIFDITIINTDAIQVYEYCNIGSAKPSIQELSNIPHKGIDILKPDEPFSILAFRELALEYIHEIIKKNRVPVLSGGSMLYNHTLLHGISPVPKTPEALRKEIFLEIQEKGHKHLYEEILKADPNTTICPENPQRVQRASEVLRMTGKPISWVVEATLTAYHYRSLSSTSHMPHTNSTSSETRTQHDD